MPLVGGYLAAGAVLVSVQRQGPIRRLIRDLFSDHILQMAQVGPLSAGQLKDRGGDKRAACLGLMDIDELICKEHPSPPFPIKPIRSPRSAGLLTRTTLEKDWC